MPPSTLLASLKDFESRLKTLRSDVKRETVSRIAKASLRNTAENLGSEWFSSIEPELKLSNIDPSILLTYSEEFHTLVKISAPNNLRSRYLTVLQGIVGKFRKELILPVQTNPPTPTSQLQTLLAGVTNSNQSEYLKEAIECSRHKLYRAAAMLGWSAAIDQIHHAIERIGFAKFNIASSAMASQTKGRFKKFNQVQNVSSLGELREVFDNIILWILEGMQLIDNNQHTRLHSCFELRSQCSHPGEAPITEYNLLSFFSDINEIVFKNPKLAI